MDKNENLRVVVEERARKACSLAFRTSFFVTLEAHRLGLYTVKIW